MRELTPSEIAAIDGGFFCFMPLVCAPAFGSFAFAKAKFVAFKMFGLGFC
ncbi:hypothetical protein [Stenotrophomonas panacihumi]|nr:hypothetical protein [Stenotrophomonas panacihumi]